jgi:hypothetical protein
MAMVAVGSAIAGLTFACSGDESQNTTTGAPSTQTSVVVTLAPTTTAPTTTTVDVAAVKAHLVAVLNDFGATLGEGWQDAGVGSVDNELTLGDTTYASGGADCAIRAIGINWGTGTHAPYEGIGEWSRAEAPTQNDITYGFESHITGRKYQAITRIAVITSPFPSVEEAVMVLERLRTGVTESCLVEKPIGVGLPDGLREATWVGELVNGSVSGADDSVVLFPTVVVEDGRWVRNVLELGSARRGRMLVSTVMAQGLDEPERLTPEEVIEAVLAGLDPLD